MWRFNILNYNFIVNYRNVKTIKSVTLVKTFSTITVINYQHAVHYLAESFLRHSSLGANSLVILDVGVEGLLGDEVVLHPLLLVALAGSSGVCNTDNGTLTSRKHTRMWGLSV